MDTVTNVRQAGPQYPKCDADRAAAGRKRRQFLEGTWLEQLAVHGTKQLGALRASLVGEWDLSANLFKSVIEQTCTMYDEQPEVSKGTLATLLDDGGWWTCARQHQQYVRGLHESLVYVGWDPEAKLPTFELITGDLVTIDASPFNRTRPVTVWWARQRAIPGSNDVTDMAWFWDRWSIAGGKLTFSIWTNDRARDVTEKFPDAARFAAVAAAELKDEEGRALLPFVVYHDRGPAQGLWSPVARDEEVVFGTLQVGLVWTANVHGVLRASWSQRVLLNGKVKGGTTEQTAGYAIRTVKPDPTAILQVDGDNAAIAEWSSPLDIDKSERFGRMYEGRLAVHFGIPPTDLIIESLNPASGASIVVSQAGKRAIAKRDSINFRRGDRSLFELVAAVARANGVACTAKGVRVRYHGVSLTIDERSKVIVTVKQELEAGLLDRVAAYQELHPGTTVDEAEADLAAMDARVAAAALAAELETAKRNAALAPTGGPTTPVQDTALNGAQVASAVDIVTRVAGDELPRDSGVAMLEEFFQLDPTRAEKIMGSVGNGFEAAPKPEPPPFGGLPHQTPPPDPNADPPPEA